MYYFYIMASIYFKHKPYTVVIPMLMTSRLHIKRRRRWRSASSASCIFHTFNAAVRSSLHSTKGGAVETGCSDLYVVMYWFTV